MHKHKIQKIDENCNENQIQTFKSHMSDSDLLSENVVKEEKLEKEHHH